MKLNRRQLRKIIMESIHHADVNSVEEMVDVFRKAALKAGFYEVEHQKKRVGTPLRKSIAIGYFTRLTPEQQSIDWFARNKEVSDRVESTGKFEEDEYDLLRFKPEERQEILNKLIKADSRIGSMMRDPSMKASTQEEPLFPAYFVVYLDKAHKF